MRSEPVSPRPRAACALRPLLTSRPVIGAPDRRNDALHGVVQDLLGARMDRSIWLWQLKTAS